MNRLRVHSNEVMDGKIFIAFISLIMKAQLENIINEDINRNIISTAKVLKELAKIKITTLHNSKTIMLALTKQQKEIFNKFNLSEQMIKKC